MSRFRRDDRPPLVSAEAERTRMVARQAAEMRKACGIEPVRGVWVDGVEPRPAPRMVSAEAARAVMIRKAR